MKKSSSEFNLDAVKSEIEKENKIFSELVAAGHAAGLAECYTTDAKFMSAGAPAIVGRDDIEKVMTGIIESGITGLENRLDDVHGTEELLASEGELTLYAGDDAVAVEKYIVIWKKEDGRWRMFRDIFNSNVPVD